MAKRAADAEVHESVLVARPKDGVTKRREQTELLVGLKAEVFNSSMQVLKDHMRFRDVDIGKDMTRDPAYHEMCVEFGTEEEAEKAYRLAAAGWMSAADAPVGIKNAMNIAIGIMKANAAEKGGSKVLNIAKVEIAAGAVPQFEEIEVE